MNLSTGIVGTVAGNGEKGVPVDGADARTQPLVDPRAVAVDSAGQIYICERGGHALRVVDAQRAHPHRGRHRRAGFSGDGGPALKATMSGPKHISIDADGSRADHRHREPRDPALPSRPAARSSASPGPAQQGAAGLDGPPDQLQLNRPHGAFRYKGALYISDSENHRVIAID